MRGTDVVTESLSGIEDGAWHLTLRACGDGFPLARGCSAPGMGGTETATARLDTLATTDALALAWLSTHSSAETVRRLEQSREDGK